MTDETPRPPETPEFAHVTPGGETHRYGVDGSLDVRKFSVGPFDNNVYVISCAETRKALLVDGPADPDRVLSELEGFELSAIVVTHSHPDHVQALPTLVERTGAPVFCHPSDAARMTVEAKHLHGSETLSVGTVEVEVWHTPGHTPGSLSLIARSAAAAEAHLFSGDTLFPGGPGNTEGKQAKFQEVMRSIDRLFTLPDGTRISPGHGLDSTIGRERPHVETWRARGW